MLKSKPTISSLGILCCCFQSSGWFVWNMYLAVMAHRDLVILTDRSREEMHLEKNKNFPSLEFLWPSFGLSSGMCHSHPGPDVILGRCQGIFRGVLFFSSLSWKAWYTSAVPMEKPLHMNWGFSEDPVLLTHSAKTAPLWLEVPKVVSAP